MDDEPGSLLVQVTSSSNHSARVAKALAEPRILEWITRGNRFVVWTWSLKAKNGAKKLWTIRETRLQVSDYAKDVM